MTSFTVPESGRITERELCAMDPHFAADLVIWMKGTGWTQSLDTRTWVAPESNAGDSISGGAAVMWGIRIIKGRLELFIRDPAGRQVAAVPVSVDQIIATGRAFAEGGRMNPHGSPLERLNGCSYTWGFPQKET